MAKKKAKKSSRKTAKSTKKSSKKRVAKKKGATRRLVAVKKKSPRKAAKKRPAKKKTSKPTLGRPKVTGDEKLYMLFKEDFHARQIFAFLNVETVRELEEYSPGEIVKLLSKPIRQSVDGIRKLLADRNRHLLDDKEFALEYKAKHKEK
jgi:DNA-binding protein HU-beta